MKRFSIIIAAMLAFFTVGFLVADHFGYMDPEKVHQWFAGLQQTSRGQMAVAGIISGLLAVDLILPIPSSVIMAASGMLLGVWIGGIASFLGAILAACSGFWICRRGGRRVFRRLIGNQETRRIDRWFSKYGVYAIIISRPIPMLTEILSCLAGLSALRFRTFLLSSILGTLPICFVYSYFGSRGDITDPWPAVWVSIVIPAIGWVIARRIKGNVH